ncbi:MAG: hypothetical protein KA248_14380 [Kiritimatiellae bacterium]|nr:hypothetical protein [Kiritimatiellia bacterium]
MKIPVIMGAALLAGLLPGCRRPDDGPHIVVINRTGAALMEIRVATGAAGEWGTNALVTENLLPDQTSIVALAERTLSAPFRLLAVDADGREMMWAGLSLTSGAPYELTTDHLTPETPDE